MNKRKVLHIHSTQIIPIGFFSLILLGTLLLWLPFSTSPGEKTDFLTALFTSTTSVCVTGLVVVDTFAHWSVFGKIVILLLIQIGGLGVITFSSILLMLIGKKLSLKERLLVRDAFNLNTARGLFKFLIRVVRGSLIVEGTGALLYLIAFIPKYGFWKGIGIAIFTAVSAFCNAGLDLIGKESLTPFRDDPLVLIVTMLLIVIGGLGYVVWFNLTETAREVRKQHFSPFSYFRRLNAQSKAVLLITGVFILSGAAFVFFLERKNEATLGSLPTGNQILNSFFQSVTFRTAGFSTIDQGMLKPETAIIGLFYMFVGGSPVGTAGGVKTLTALFMVLSVVSFIRGKQETVLFDRRVPERLLRKATAIVTVNFMLTFVMCILLIITNKVQSLDAVFEVTSAVATVGLSRGITAGINAIGRVIIIICMFLGRIGPITMALFLSNGDPDKKLIQHAEGKFIAG